MMNIKRINYFIVSMMCLSCTLLISKVHAQVKYSSSVVSDVKYARKIKQIDEFIDRINFQLRFMKGNQWNELIIPKNKREEFIALLFKENVKNVISSDMKSFKKYVATMEPGSVLQFADDKWYAELECNIKIGAQKQKIKIIMQPEISNPKGTKWVIVAMNGDCDLFEKPQTTKTGINPSNHSINFSGLSKAFVDTQNLSNYFSKEIKSSSTLCFLDAARKGQVEIGRVENIKYHFLQVDGWIFTVENFDYINPDYGWLISSLYQADDNQKYSFIQDLRSPKL